MADKENQDSTQSPPPVTQFCPKCGRENSASVNRCAYCGGAMDETARSTDSSSSLPLKWKWVAMAFVAMGGLIALTNLTPLKKNFFALKIKETTRVRRVTDADEINAIRKELPEQFVKKGIYQLRSGRYVSYQFGRIQILERAEILMATGKMYTVVSTALIFLLIGALVGLLSKRKTLREMGLAGLGAILMVWFFWLWGADWQIKRTVTETLHIQSDSILMKMPSSLFLITACILYVMSGVAGSTLGTSLASLICAKTHCPHCDASVELRPQRPTNCPSCGQALKKGRFRWAWVAPSSLATCLAFYIAVAGLGTPLGFYFTCDFNHRSDDCREGLRVFKVAGRKGSNKVILWRKKGEKRTDRGTGVILHTWKYILYLSLLFFFAPFIVAWRSKKGALSSAGFTILFNWLGATLTAMLFLGFAQFEGVFMNSLRIHVLAGIPWCLLGAIGALAGHRLATSKNLYGDLDALDDPDASENS